MSIIIKETDFIYRNEVENCLHSNFYNLMKDDFPKRTIVADERYEPVNIFWIVNFINNQSILAPKNYKEDIFDCDDYTMYLKTQVSLIDQNTLSAPRCVGIILTQRHAFNFCIDVIIIDDQQNKRLDLHIIDTTSKDRETTNIQNEFGKFLEHSSNNIIQLIYI
jgi:hypothetical protein